MEQLILQKCRGEQPLPRRDVVAEEVCLQLFCGDTLLNEFYCLPSDFAALSLGYLFAEGFVRHCSELTFCGDAILRQDGSYALTVEFAQNLPQKGKAPLAPVHGTGRGDLLCRASGEIHWDRAMDYEGALLAASGLFQSTGCIHAAMLCRGGKACYFGEDISRFFALYKALGKALAAGEELSSFVLCTTGRLPAPYLERVARSGIGCVISRSAPTTLSLALAARLGIAVFGFAGANKINYYPPQLACCVLAGGKASRAGGVDKALLTHGGSTFLERTARALAPEGELLVSYNRAPQALAGVLEPLGRELGQAVRVLRDTVPECGPLGGLYSVLAQCGAGAVLFAPCDTPFYTAAVAQACKQAFTGLEDAVVVKAGERLQPLCAVYSKACLPVMERMLQAGRYRLTDLLEQLDVTYVDAFALGMDEKQFTNINTIREYEAIERME